MSAWAWLGLAAALGACEIDRTIGLSTDPNRVQVVSRPLRFLPEDRIDVLVVMDDSASMAAKQARVRAELPGFLLGLAETNVRREVRFGVITSDLGAPGVSCGKDRGGALIAVGADADPSCQPPLGASWLSLGSTGSNAPLGQNAERTITCMTSVGESGCGFEMPLEALRRQLRITGADRFVRSFALLIVLFVTDEDDCSVPDDSDLFGNDASLGPLTSFRCAASGIACGGQLLNEEVGGRDGCRPAVVSDGSRLIDPSEYVRLLGRPASEGGVKDDPLDVIVAAIEAPPTPVAVASSSDPAVCGAGVDECPVLVPSCTEESSGTSGDPAVRMGAVLRATGGLARSICDTSYRPFFDALRARVEAAATGNACVPGAVVDTKHPDCTVTLNGARVPRCDEAVDQTICWYLEPDERCPTQTDPRTGDAQDLHMRLVGVAPDDVQAACAVLTAQ